MCPIENADLSARYAKIKVKTKSSQFPKACWWGVVHAERRKKSFASFDCALQRNSVRAEEERSKLSHFRAVTQRPLLPTASSPHSPSTLLSTSTFFYAPTSIAPPIASYSLYLLAHSLTRCCSKRRLPVGALIFSRHAMVPSITKLCPTITNTITQLCQLLPTITQLCQSLPTITPCAHFSSVV